MSTHISRKTLLISAGAIAAVGGSTYLIASNLGSGQSNPLRNPSEIVSSNGELSTELTVAKVDKPLAGGTVQMLSYNGTTPGPTLRVKPGDTIKLKLVNNLGRPTNLHTHGLFVSPKDNADNPFVHVMSGESFDYEYQITDDHAEGTHWYHPHLHGDVASQVFGGLYGAIIVEDETTPKVSEDRVIIISDASFNSDGSLTSPNMMDQMMGREGDYILVNGEFQPKGETKANAIERWRIVNACVSRYLSLQVTGGTATLLGLDGQKFSHPEEFQTRELAPGNRADLLVQVKTDKVSLVYTTVAHPDAGMMGMSSQTYADYPLVTFSAKGDAEITEAKPTFKTGPDLRTAGVTGKRTFTLAMPNHGMAMGATNMTGMFTINGESFNHDKINTKVANDSVEEWTIVNNSTMQHPFHLHIWPMQLLSVNGQEIKTLKYQDVVTVPAQGQVVLRVNFHTHTGKTLYHCHILDHEDLGMMGIIESA